ncbi:unnamed protein product [Ixodes hexagonus]
MYHDLFCGMNMKRTYFLFMLHSLVGNRFTFCLARDLFQPVVPDLRHRELVEGDSRRCPRARLAQRHTAVDHHSPSLSATLPLTLSYFTARKTMRPRAHVPTNSLY